jgi:glucose/arabinose dehydrogenase
MQVRALTPIALALLVGVLACLLFATPATTLPSDFTDSLVTGEQGLAPTALAFPDDRILIASRPGELRVYKNGALLGTPALDLKSEICDNKERGLLGLAVDPNFSTNHYVYLYYTYRKHGVCPQDQPASNKNPVNRVSRFVMDGNTVDQSIPEDVLIDNIPSPNGNHNAGDLHFGKDGNLYVSVGDGGCNLRRPNMCQYDNAAARYRNVLLGKVLRVEPDGDVPPDNPYATDPDSAPCAEEEDGQIAPGDTCQEIFALGFRNPFRFAVDPDAPGTVLRVNDVGGARWEEIDEIDTAVDAGADYGWNLCEGRHDNPERGGKVKCNGNTYTGPIHEYKHGKKKRCTSITGGAFVPNEGSWPASYDDSYLFADFVCNRIFELKPQQDGTGFRRTLFAKVGGGGPVAMEFGPSDSGQALYYTTFADGGQVRRIAYTGP